jgi:LPS O-antigen subunit length determinant protein (WzzB/FepE family)
MTEKFAEQFKRHAELARQREKSREKREKREEESRPDPAELQRWIETGKMEAPASLDPKQGPSPLPAVFTRRSRHVR